MNNAEIIEIKISKQNQLSPRLYLSTRTFGSQRSVVRFGNTKFVFRWSKISGNYFLLYKSISEDTKQEFRH